MPTYTHAKDFLIELAENQNTYGWLKDLIIRVINTNGNLTDGDLDATKEQLKTNGASTLTVPTARLANATSLVRFKKLTHKSGVCALAPNQTIDFSEDITLIYGGNGSGKSSYFRILNEIVGGNRQINLHHNIYTTESQFDVDIEYTENGEVKSILWDGSNRALEPLNLTSVFDTEYSSTFLQRRSADEAIVMPYGLHLFTALTGAMESIKGRIDNEIDAIIKLLPSINQEGLSDNIKRIITQKHFTSSQQVEIESKYNITTADIQKLTACEQQLKKLVETNYEDKIKISTNEKQLFDDLRIHLSDTLVKLEEFYIQSSELFFKIKETRKASDEAKAKIAVLSEIGNTDSSEWRSFISSGGDYAKASNMPDDVCPYCRQRLTTDAKRIVIAYSDYLLDKSQGDLARLLNKKELYKAKIEKEQVLFKINGTLRKCIEQQTNFPSLNDDIQKALEALLQFKNTLVAQYADENFSIKQAPDIISSVVTILQKISDDYSSTISKFNDNKSRRDVQINALKEQMKNLIEHKAISSQKELFKDWFAKLCVIHELESSKSHLTTRTISSLAKTAGQQLVTDNLKVKFQEELNEIGLNKLHVDLEEASVSRGKSYMQIHLTKNVSAKEILSEGEQKGVALALFIAERRMQLTSNPIILDDPVNSLDHRIIGRFIERLAKLDNQIIIFSHNVLLKTTLLSLGEVHECGKNQRYSCKKHNRHLFLYLVQSQGRDLKGVITEGKQENAKNYLQAAKRKLDSIPFTDLSGTTSSLRHAIELMVDEVILNNQVPVKFHGKKNNIYWDQLKELRPDATLIDKLKFYFSRLSGGDLHAGVEQTENPINHDELVEIYTYLSSVLQ